MHQKELKYCIISPVGGIGNHIRWLMLLDDKFDFFPNEGILLPDWNETLYYNLKGDRWPQFNANFSKMPQFVKEECKQLVPHEVSTVKKVHNSAEAKVKYILQHIYPLSRTWNNWLSIELEHRTYLNKCIIFSHDIPDDNQNHRGAIITIDPLIAYMHYLKFNTSLSGITKEHFITAIKHHNKISYSASNSLLVEDSEALYASTLDRSVYERLISAFGADDNYNSATIIHRRWHKLQLKAEQEFVNDITNIYKI